MPSEFELCVMSQQLDALRAFAARLPLLGAEAEIERFLCHHNMLEDGEWAQVLAYNASVPPPPFEIRSPIDDYTVSAAGQQWRLIVEFGSQYPINPTRQAEQFIRDIYKLTVRDWEMVDEFLSSQEAGWLEQKKA